MTYLMFKWKSGRKQHGRLLRHHLVHFSEVVAGMESPAANGFATNPVLDGETECLRHLRAHLTLVQPGASYAAHADAYDVGIVVLEGTVETLGQRVGPHGVIFYSAGELHGMKNAGEGPALYMVFEFHGRHTEAPEPYDPRLSRRVLGVLRDPRRLRRAITRRAYLWKDAVRPRMASRGAGHAK